MPPKSQACSSLLSPNLMPHRVPEDGQEGPLEEDAELCEGAGGKGVAFNGIHFLGRGHWIRRAYPTHPLHTQLSDGKTLEPFPRAGVLQSLSY